MTIQKRGERKYGVKVYVPGEGQRWVGTFSSLKKAKTAEAEALLEAHKPKPVHITIAELGERWLTYHASHLAESTQRTYAESVKAFCKEYGDLPAPDFTRSMAREWALRVPYTRRSAMRTMFQMGVEDGYVPINPLSNLRIKQSRGRKDTIPFRTDDPEKRVKMLHHTADAALTIHGDYGPTFRAMILFAAYTGVRPSELFVLRWDDLDFERGTMWVQRALRAGVIGPPKNGKIRQIALPPQAQEALHSFHPPAGEPLLFTTKRASRFAQPTLSMYWGPVRAAAGFEGKDFYELRHFCATFLLERGLSADDVALQLGHTDGGKLVLSTYGHPSVSASRARIYAAFDS